MSFTFLRLTFPVVFGLVVFAVWTSRKSRAPRQTPVLSQPTFVLLLALGLYKILATYANGVAPLYALETFLLTVGAFWVFYEMASGKLVRAVAWSFALTAVLIIMITPLELLAQRPLHFFIADRNAILQEELVIRLNDRGYRLRGMFDNSLRLAEYLMYAMPFVLYLRSRLAGAERLMMTGLLCGIVGVGLLTDSRGFIVFGGLSILAFALAYRWTSLSRLRKWVWILLTVPIFAVSATGSVYVIQSLIEQGTGISFHLIETAEERSSLSRALQFREIYLAVRESPIFGFGVLQNFADQLDQVRRIDNYYLRSALEAGVPGLIGQVALVIAAFFALARRAEHPKLRSDRAFYAFGMSLIVAHAGAKVFVSAPTNNFIFFALLGLLLGLKAKSRFARRDVLLGVSVAPVVRPSAPVSPAVRGDRSPGDIPGSRAASNAPPLTR